MEYGITFFEKEFEMWKYKDRISQGSQCVTNVTKGNKTDQLSNSEGALLWRKLKDLLIKVDKSTSQPEKCLSFPVKVFHKEIPPTHPSWKTLQLLKENEGMPFINTEILHIFG